MPKASSYWPTPQVCRALLEFPTQDKFIEIRASAILALIYGAGADCPSIGRLKRKDIDAKVPGTMVVTVTTHSTSRLVPLPQDIVPLIDAYLDVLQPAANDAAFIADTYGKPIKVLSPAWYALKARSRALGLPAIVTPYMLRRACAQHLVDGGMAIEAVAQFVGLSGPAEVARMINLRR